MDSSDPLLEQSAEPERLRQFLDALENDGFARVAEDEWQGPIRASLVEGGFTDATTMTVIIRPSWPYLSPLLRVPGIAAWHADRERLCIWHAEDNSQRWVTPHGIYERIDEWCDEAADDFSRVENARNPEIYWQQPMPSVAALVDLDALIGRDRTDGQYGKFHFTEAAGTGGAPARGVFQIQPGPFTARTSLPGGMKDHQQLQGRWFYRANVTRPPRDFAELEGMLTDTQRGWLQKDLRRFRHVMFGLVWENNAGLVCTMLFASLDQSGVRYFALVWLRPSGARAVLLRAGPDAASLQPATVAILGVGAIGSHVAEELARSGVGKLKLYDYDDLWPANLVRHAAPPGTPPGTLKTDALREHLIRYPWVDVEIPAGVREGIVWAIGDIREAVVTADLTIDATGHPGLAELVARVAEDEGRPFVSVALFRGGAVARVRRQVAGDTSLLQRPHLDRYPVISPLDDEVEYVGTETGCLSLVHNAPPVAVAHAAVLATEVTIDLLTGRREQPDEIIEVLRGGEPPFDRLGRLEPSALPVTVDVTERAARTIRDAHEGCGGRETGGVLVGCIIDERIVVVDAIELPDVHATAASYTVPAGATQGAVLRAREDDDRLGYVGEWHTHLRPGGPSSLDVATMQASADEQGIRLVLLVSQPEDDGSSPIDAYVTDDRGLRVATVAPAGDLPRPERTAG